MFTKLDNLNKGFPVTLLHKVKKKNVFWLPTNGKYIKTIALMADTLKIHYNIIKFPIEQYISKHCKILYNI
jgi:hypothetical protein